MKAPLWRRCMERHVIPHLPGTWTARGSLVYREPADWFLCYLMLRSSRWSTAFDICFGVQLLAVPSKHLAGPTFEVLGRGEGKGLWPAPESVDDAEPIMNEILDLVQRQALPYFDQLGTVRNYLDGAKERASRQPGDVHFQEVLFCLYILEGNVEAALAAAQATQQAVEAETRDWAQDIGRRVAQTAEALARDVNEARNILSENAAQTRTNLGMQSRPTPRRSDS